MSDVVVLTDVRRDFTQGDVTIEVLRGANLTIGQGELVALLGPSGCGKTAALRCLAGLEDPDSGTITVGGADVIRVPTNKRDMGMVFQAYALFPNLTVAQNIAFGLQGAEIDQAAVERAARIAALAAVFAAPHWASGSGRAFAITVKYSDAPVG